MPDCSIVDAALQLGGQLARVVDLETGELLSDAYAPEGISATGKPGGGRFARFPVGVEGGDAARLPGREEASAPGGLSNPHICTQNSEGSVEIWVGGGLLHCKKPVHQQDQVGGGKRGKVSEFSAASRRRMLYLVGKIDRAKLPIMVTLTYPAEWPVKSSDWKRHLKNWWHRLKRKVPGVGAIWKLEPQKRGAPHYHLLIWGLEGVPLGELIAWVSRSWYQVVGSGDERHLWAGTRVEPIRSRQGVLRYATKYLGKINEAGAEGWDEPGRFWGGQGSGKYSLG